MNKRDKIVYLIDYLLNLLSEEKEYSECVGGNEKTVDSLNWLIGLLMTMKRGK